MSSSNHDKVMFLMPVHEPRHSTVTAVWVLLNALPLVVLLLISLASKSWLVGLCLLVLYPLLLVPYGILVSLPLMVKIFRRPASLPSKRQSGAAPYSQTRAKDCSS